MPAGQLTIANTNVADFNGSSLFGKIDNLVARVFGCWHANLSRPFSREGRAYRTCLNCGAQRHFHLGKWQMQGQFYYRNPAIN